VPLAVVLGLALVAAVVLMVTSRRSATIAASASRSPAAVVAMIAIPAGTYTIGATGAGSASPPYQVALPQFSIEKTEVTVGAYREYAAATNTVVPWGAVYPDPTLPVTRVSWPEARGYCAWRYPEGRLPTEEEWEAAATGLTKRAYPWGDTFDPGAANTASAGRAAPAPVGSYPRGATPLGVQDMIGNVWEWTSSPMRPYRNGGAMPPAVTTNTMVIRGGAFNTLDRLATVSFRGYSPPTTKPDDLAATGFRCVKG
jgi:formylglycine-generating enzyme required for sulfatase activity